jgi:hypothetical protein
VIGERETFVFVLPVKRMIEKSFKLIEPAVGEEDQICLIRVIGHVVTGIRRTLTQDVIRFQLPGRGIGREHSSQLNLHIFGEERDSVTRER